QADNERRGAEGSREERQQRLGGVQRQERGRAGECNRQGGLAAHWTILLRMKQNRTLATGLAAAALLTVAPSAQTPSTRMFVGAPVYDGTDRPPVDNAVIMVRDGKITQIAKATPELVRAAGSVSLAGKTIVPGLVNAHGHVGGTVGLQGNHYSAENVT